MMGISQSAEPTIELIGISKAKVKIRVNLDTLKSKEGQPYIRFLYQNNQWKKQDIIYVGQFFFADSIQVSDDDKYLLFVSQYHIYLIDLRKPLEQRRQRILAEDVHDCAFSPNTRLLLAYNRVKHHLSVFNLDTGKQLIIDRGWSFSAGWYPDSRHIWYQRDTPPTTASVPDRVAYRPTAILGAITPHTNWQNRRLLLASASPDGSEGIPKPKLLKGKTYEYDLLTRRRRVIAPEAIAKRWELTNPRFMTGRGGVYADRVFAYSSSGNTRLVLSTLDYGDPQALKPGDPQLWVEWRDGRRRVVWRKGSHDWAYVQPIDVSDDGEWALVSAAKLEDVPDEFGGRATKFYAFVLVNTRTREEKILLKKVPGGTFLGWRFTNGPEDISFWLVVRLRFVYPQGARR